MRLGQRIDDLRGVLKRLRDRDRAFGWSIGERLALDILHHEVTGTVAGPDVVQRVDVRVVEGGDRARFLLEPAATIGICGEIRREHFDRDGATQPRVAGLLDLAHPAGADEGGGHLAENVSKRVNVSADCARAPTRFRKKAAGHSETAPPRARPAWIE